MNLMKAGAAKGKGHGAKSGVVTAATRTGTSTRRQSVSAPDPKQFDVLGLGCAAVDDLLYVPRFPGVDEKVQVERSV